MIRLAQKKCIPCEQKGIQPLSCEQVTNFVEQYADEIAGWTIDSSCTKMFFEKTFLDFVSAMNWVRQVADIAESQGHHPNIIITYNRVRLDLWTHSMNGLSENDFIVAAQITAL